MQNFLFRKNSHSASVVAKALPRLPESPPSPAIRPRLGLRLAHPTNRRRQPPSHGPPPPKTGVPQKQRRENARKPECRDANGPRHRRNAPRQAGTPLRRRTKPQDAAICRSPSDVWADGASERIRRFAAECRSDTPPNRPANRSAADECYRRRQKIRPLDRVLRAGATVLPLVCRAAAAKRPTAPYSARGRRQRRRAAKPAQSDVCANLLRGPDKKTSGPIRTPRPARHRAGYDTHPIHGRLRTPGKPAQAATSPAQRDSGTETTCRTQRNSSPTTSLSPTSSHAESALTAPRRTPSARSAATNRTTRSVPSAPQPRRLQCPQPCRIQRSQPPGRIRRP